MFLLMTVTVHIVKMQRNKLKMIILNQNLFQPIVTHTGLAFQIFLEDPRPLIFIDSANNFKKITL